jgi:hypothetical protein
MIILCSCENKYQDKRYGKGHRVGNEKPHTPGQTPMYRCTVCKKETGSVVSGRSGGKK